MLSLNPEKIQTVLCLGAHADDIEIGCGGTLLELIEENPRLQIHWIVLSGNEIRHREASYSAEFYLNNVMDSHIQLKRFRDSYFPDQWAEIKDYFHELSQQIEPDLIFTHSREDSHQDHRVVSELTSCAFRNHMIMEYEIPKFDGDLQTPNCYLPVSERKTKQKVDLLMECFSTQTEKPWFDDLTFRGLMRLRGVECQSPSMMAEGFHVRKIRLEYKMSSSALPDRDCCNQSENVPTALPRSAP